MCRQAVDRSQGQLIDIDIEYFGTEELLQYIGERSKVKCLRLTCCPILSNKGLAEAAEFFPELEEFQLKFTPDITGEDIERIGTCCPKLKSFAYYPSGFIWQVDGNDCAVAIAKSMPNLHHLELRVGEIDNEGLKGILDGCSYLESLYVCNCFPADLRGDLGKRFSQQRTLASGTAIDLRQGQLIDIDIENIGNDNLLMCIARRSKHLKCLRLTRCYEISSKGLARAAERLPDLEELNVSFMFDDLTDMDIETIGTSCPQLKSFAYNTPASSRNPLHKDNGSAFAIAKSMPNLHHLGLCDAGLDNEGLEAILDSCPHLESLDIRKCFFVGLNGDLGKSCSQQIRQQDMVCLLLPQKMEVL